MAGGPLQLPAHWDLSKVRQIADGIGGRVYEAIGRDGISVIVKQPSTLAIDDGEPPRGADFLRWRDGCGAVRLLDQAGDLMLLEHAGSRPLLSLIDERGDDAATEIACDVLQRLHAEPGRPAPPSLEPLPVHFRSLFAKAAADRDAGIASQFVEAASVAERLFANQSDHRPLHGDIHHENIIDGPRGWLAIDPKGLIGDRAFDAANLFYNPLEGPLRHSDSRAAAMVSILSARTGISRAHLLDHAFAFSALSASWHAEDGNQAEAAASLAVGRAVRAVRNAVSL